MLGRKVKQTVERVKRFWISTSLGNTNKEFRAINSNAVSDYNQALSFEDIPGPRGIKYLGTLHHYMTGRLDKYKYKDILEENFSKYGPIFKETLFDITIVHVCDPGMFELIYKDEGKYPEIEPLVQPSQKFRGEGNLSLGLGNSNGENWYNLRAIVQKSMLRPMEVSSYLHVINEIAQNFVEKAIHKGHSDDFLMDASIWKLESGGALSFGKRLGYLEYGSTPEMEAIKLVKMVDNTFTLATDLKFSLPLYRYTKTPTYKALRESEQYINDVTSVYLSETLRNIESGLDGMGDVDKIQNTYRFLYSLFCQNNLSKKEMEVIVLSMFIDGLRTVVPVFISVLFCLSQTPQVQEKLFNEIHAVLGDRKFVAASDIAQMPYLKACVKETFRLYPIGLEISRINHEDIVLGKYKIPSGTKLNLNNFLLNKDPNVFADPDSFLPHRWLRGSEHAVDAHPFLLLPFSRGPRMCVGRRFAEQDLYVLISKFIQSCEPHWRGEKYKHQFKMLLYPDCPIKFQFKPRLKTSSN